MDRFKQRIKNEKPVKSAPKDKYVFIKDVKTIKENLKIKEILRTVKMNSSMRLKAPTGSKIMSNKDFNDDDCVEGSPANQTTNEPISACNPNVVVSEFDTNEDQEETENYTLNKSKQHLQHKSDDNLGKDSNELDKVSIDKAEEPKHDEFNIIIASSNSSKEGLGIKPSVKPEKLLDRKLSLDQSILSRRPGFSQSELDLHSLGKSPLERKVSFFKKKMDSFVRNTTEMFKRQNESLQRRGSMSMSLQSLNEKFHMPINSEESESNDGQEALSTSRTSLQTVSSIGRSNSSLSMRQSGQSCAASENSLAGSQPSLHALSSSTLEALHSNSVHSLNESYLKEAMLNSRAISMSSGLDLPLGRSRTKASRSNRVTWVASEGLTNYFRRLIQDEKSKELQSCHSYQDFSSIPENELYNRQDTRGRKSSYQRAVSGDDPELMKYDSSLRRKNLIHDNEAHYELSNMLAEFTRNGIPALQNFDIAAIPEEAFAYLQWASKQKAIEEFYDWKQLSPEEVSRQAAIRELIYTEADYIRHLISIVEVFIGAAHALQSKGKLLRIDTSLLFSNIPDVLNANLYFWYYAFVPMIKAALINLSPFNIELMAEGFSLFKDIMTPYEKYLIDQKKLLEYSRQNHKDGEFAIYLAWCHGRKECNRLQLNDFLVKPMQRLTKYGLLLNRIAHFTRNETEGKLLKAMEQITANVALEINRSVRQNEEIEKISALQKIIENFDCEIKDEEVEKLFNSYSKLNLSAPMLYCLPIHQRTLIHQADLRFRDAAKEIDCRAYLLTDMLIICRRLSRGNKFKLYRPRYMIDRIVQISKSVSKHSDATSLVFLMLDEHGTSCSTFILSEMPKDPNPQQTLKTMENKVKEAKYTYEIALWMSRNPTRDISEIDLDLKEEYAHYKKPRNATEESQIEQDARESVLTMIHRGMGANQDSSTIASYHNYESLVMGISARPPGRNSMPRLVQRTTTSSLPFHQRQHTPQHSSTMSLQESGLIGMQTQRSHSSMEYLQPPPLSAGPSTITVRVISESESETVTPQRVSLQPSPTPSRTSQTCSTNTLRVQEPQPNVHTLIHSLPDLTIEPSTPRTTSSPTHPIHMSASIKLYKSHQQLLSQRQRAQGQFLTPDQRGASYPPPSPTRGSLKRSLAFSYSFKHPPLHKMGHVASQSTTQFDPGASTSQQVERAESPRISSNVEKSEKKSKLTSSRRKRRDISQDRYSEPCTSRRDESPDPFRRDESPSPSYRDESPGTSYKDESTDLSGIDRSSSLSHKDESPATSHREESPAYRDYRRSSSGRDKSPDQSHGADDSPDPRSIELSPSSSYREKSPDRYRDSSSSDRHKDISPSTSRGSVSPDAAQRKKSFSSKAVSLSPIASTDEIPGLSIGESSRTSLKDDDSQKSPDYHQKDKSPSARITDESWSDSTERLEIRKPALRPTREQTPGPSRRIRSLSPVVVCDIPIFYQGESSSNIIQTMPLPSYEEDDPSTSYIKPSSKEKRRSFFRRSRKKEESKQKIRLDTCLSVQKSEDSESSSKEPSNKEPSPSSSGKSKKSNNGKRRWFRRV